MAAKSTTDHIHALRKNMRDENVETRLMGIEALASTASLMGPEATRNQLLPFVSTIKDGERAMQKLAEIMGTFTDLVGGSAYTACLLKPLINLANNQSTIVHNTAIESLKLVMSVLSDEDVSKKVFPEVRVLISSQRPAELVTACHLLAICYPRGNSDDKIAARSDFRKLCENQNENSELSSVAVESLGRFAIQVGTQYIQTDFIDICSALADHNVDMVRNAAISSFKHVASDVNCANIVNTHLSTAVIELAKVDNYKHRGFAALLFADCYVQASSQTRAALVHAFKNLCGDESTDVRHIAAFEMGEFAQVMESDYVMNDLFPYWKNLARDTEHSVRLGAFMSAHHMCSSLNDANQVNKIFDSVIPCVKESMKHWNEQTAIPKLCQMLDCDQTIDTILPLILNLLETGGPAVRVSIISNLQCIHEAIGADNFSQSLAPPLSSLARRAETQVRSAIMGCMGEKYMTQTFAAQLYPIWLTDADNNIRDEGIVNITKCMHQFGSDWIERTITPLARSLACNEHEDQGTTALLVFGTLSELPGLNVDWIGVLPIVLKLANKEEPSMKLVARITLRKISKHFTKEIYELHVRDKLVELSSALDDGGPNETSDDTSTVNSSGRLWRIFDYCDRFSTEAKIVTGFLTVVVVCCAVGALSK